MVALGAGGAVAEVDGWVLGAGVELCPAYNGHIKRVRTIITRAILKIFMITLTANVQATPNPRLPLTAGLVLTADHLTMHPP